MNYKGYKIEPGAYLRGASLSNANLYGANLSNADLSGANLYGTEGNGEEIVNLILRPWLVVFTKDQMAIGCEQHLISEWFNFSDSEINEMDSYALKWWNNHKEILKQLIEVRNNETS